MGCFVNKESICPKNITRFPGVYSSTQPCKDPRTPNLKSLFLGRFETYEIIMSKSCCKSYISKLFGGNNRTHRQFAVRKKYATLATIGNPPKIFVQFTLKSHMGTSHTIRAYVKRRLR